MPALGPFHLLQSIGRGGSGVVWKARHVGTGERVAVKLLSAGHSWDERARRAFVHEIHAVAGLDHPNIVRVHDHGRVDAAAVASSDGLLQLDTPWLAMELAGGSLTSARTAIGWWDLRGALRDLLFALGHAHARGILHRDLKPGNALYIGTRLVLADFGLAMRPEDASAPDGVRSGTPLFMAPEQFDGRWRDYGPWTDLYSLGIASWLFATGTRPHGRQAGYAAYGEAHHRGKTVPWRTRIGVPDGFEAWVRSLIAPAHRDRFRSAADALAALDALVEPEAFEALEVPSLGTQPTVVASQIPTRIVTEDHRTSETEHLAAGVEHPVPPIRPEWRRQQRQAEVRQVATGLGLFGLRALPLVGRDAECAELWEALLAVRRDGLPGVVRIEGPAGSGKSRLAAWLLERAHELGQAVPMRALHGPEGGASHGLSGLLARVLCCAGLTADEAEKRLRGRVPFDAAERAALARLVSEQAGSMRAAERHGLMTRVLQQEITDARRPAVVWIDDGHWGEDALVWAERVLAAVRPLPVLIVVTVQTEAATPFAHTRERLERLCATPRAKAIHLAPLPVQERRQLVRALLPLSDALAVEVERRSAGNPLFAVQLVGACVQDDLLELVDGAFALRAGAQLELPADLAGAWARRVDRVLERRPAQDRTALVIASLLGLDVDDAEWADACARVGVQASDDLADALVRQRLANRDPHRSGWSFVHGMLADAIRLEAQQTGDPRALHRACAEMLEDRSGRDQAERLGRHRLGAGQDALAVDALALAAEERAARGEPREAIALLDQRAAAMERAGIPQDDERWGIDWVQRARVGRVAVDMGAASDWLDRAEASSRAHGWDRVLLDVLMENVFRAFTVYDLEQVSTLRAEVERLAPPLEAWEPLAEARRIEAWTRLRRRDHDGARTCAQLAVEAGEKAHSASQISRAECVLSELAAQAGDSEEALRRAESALQTARRANVREAAVQALNQLAALLVESDPRAAIDVYEEALQLAGSLGYVDPSLLLLNLGTAWHAIGNITKALDYAERARESFAAGGRKALLGHTQVVLAGMYAASRDLPALKQAIGEAETLLAATGFADPETLRAAEEGLAACDWDSEAADRLRALAEAQRAALDVSGEG